MQKLISTRQAAEMLGTTEGTLKSWRSRGVGPKWVKLGAAVRYDVEELLDFIKRNTRVPSASARGGASWSSLGERTQVVCGTTSRSAGSAFARRPRKKPKPEQLRRPF